MIISIFHCLLHAMMAEDNWANPTMDFKKRERERENVHFGKKKINSNGNSRVQEKLH